VIVLSTETNPVVQRRCEKLRLPCRSGLPDKAAALAEWLDEEGLDARDVVYVGNDINDRGCLEMVGGPVVVADAVDEVRPLARLVLSRKGGDGAVREICDLVYEKIVEKAD